MKDLFVFRVDDFVSSVDDFVSSVDDFVSSVDDFVFVENHSRKLHRLAVDVAQTSLEIHSLLRRQNTHF
jgi:5-bromo-4-chloroindolyl phosphate hydrolysis protein